MNPARQAVRNVPWQGNRTRPERLETNTFYCMWILRYGDKRLKWAKSLQPSEDLCFDPLSLGLCEVCHACSAVLCIKASL